MITLSQIHERIALAIQDSKLSQEKIAKGINVSQQAVSEYLHGKSYPALDTLANLCAFLDLDANDILCLKK